MTKQKMTKLEMEQWDNLYQYVKKEILFYDDTQSLPSSLVLRLKGLTSGKFMENNNIKAKARYSFDIILYTFQVCKPKILWAMANKQFDTEMSKFNYMLKIVENNINDVYMRVNKLQANEEKLQNLQTDVLSHSAAKYSKKTQELKNKHLNELW